MSAENARKLAGERPDEVPAEKRQEILDELKQGIASYRHCLELQTNHAPSRRNLELVRNWIKYYTDRWRDRDRQKLRDESNLIAFLDFLMKAETALQETVKQLPENVANDAFAEIKRAQDELREEVPTLREKIATELQPTEPQTVAAPQPVPPQIQEGIKLLQGWADEADNKMASASRLLAKTDAKDAASEQQAAIQELDRIWDAVIPFQPLLAKELADQTTITKSLTPETKPEAPSDTDADEIENKLDLSPESQNDAEVQYTAPANQTLAIGDDDFKQLTESQEKILRKARLLSPKAEAELSRVESQPTAEPATDPTTTTNDPNSPAQPSTIDPEEVKAGLRKAIELAPAAVVAMESAVKQLKKKDRAAAVTHAEEARRILEEIQQAQPRNKQQDQDQDQNEKNQDQENKDKQESKDQEEDERQKDGDEEKPSNEEKSDEKKSDKEEKDGKQAEQQPEEKQPKPQQVSKDRIDEALRKVRERQQEKRERDQQTRLRVIGPAPVDKDW